MSKIISVTPIPLISHLEEPARHACSTRSTLQRTYELTRLVTKNQIRGALVECGVASGSQLAAMSIAQHHDYIEAKTSQFRKIYAYDSFEGIPWAGPEDDCQPGIGSLPPPDVRHPRTERERLSSSGVSVQSLEGVIGNLRTWTQGVWEFEFIKGWFEDTMAPESSMPIPTRIALLRLDGDLYSSTKVCLEAMYERVEVGGIVIIDDFGLTGCNKACLEYFGARDIKPTYFEDAGSQGPVWFIKESM